MSGTANGRIVLDSFALVCLFNREPGWRTVQAVLYNQQRTKSRALLNWINWGEFYYVVRKRAGAKSADGAVLLLEQLPIEMVEADPALVRSAAEVKSEHAVSYADAFCIATALRRQAAVLTSDQEFEAVEHLVKVHWLSK